MSQFIVVANTVNQIATVHASRCSFLGAEPTKSTASAQRAAFGDRFDALVAAHDSRLKSFGFCGHCQAEYRDLLSRLRDD